MICSLALIFTVVILMILSWRYLKFTWRVFTLISCLYPAILAGLIFYNDYVDYKFEIYNFEFNFSFDNLSKLICLGFCLVAIAANIFNSDKKQSAIIVIGNIYFIASVCCILADDWLAMFFFLEVMMISSSFLVYAGKAQDSLNLARQYFLTHLFSSSLILIGIISIIYFVGDTKIIALTNLMQGDSFVLDDISIACLLMLVGFLINMACFPFSFWMTNCYPKALSSAFIYLINFTTKVSLFMIIKLFWGLKILEVFGISTLIYSVLMICRTDNIKKLICFLSLSQLGIILFSVSVGGNYAQYTTLYIFMHILYIGLFSVCCCILADNNIFYCGELKKINRAFLLKFSFSISVLAMIPLPFTLNFYAKKMLLSIVENNFSYYFVNLPTFLLGIMLPIREYINSHANTDINLSKNSKFSLLLLSASVLIFNFFPFSINYLYGVALKFTNVQAHSVIKQTLFIIVAIVIYKIWGELCLNARVSARVEKTFSFANNIKQIFSRYFAEIYDILTKIKLLQKQHLIDNLNQKKELFGRNSTILNSTLYITFTFLLILLLTLHYR